MKLLFVFALFLLTGCVQQEIVDSMDPSFYHDDHLKYGESSQTVFSLETDCLDSSEWSISFWIDPDALWLNTTLFSVDLNQDYLMMSTSENSQGIRNGLNVSTKSEKVTASFEDSDVMMNGWNYIVVTYDQKCSIYLNGKRIASETLKLNGTKDVSVMFGKTEHYEDPEFEGKWSDVKIINRCLSEKEISENYLMRLPEYYLSSLEFHNAEWQLGDLQFTENKDLMITYETSDSKRIEIDGLVHRDEEEGKEVVISIEAKTSLNSAKKSFDFYVPSLNEAYDQYDVYTALLQTLGKVMHSGSTLPDQTSAGKQIVWETEDALIENNRIIKTSNEKVQPVLLVCLVDGKQYEFTVQLMDEIAGYVMAYFTGEEGSEKMSMMYSYDGLNWLDFSGPVSISSSLGTCRVRDPYLYRDVDGSFLVVATMGYDNPEIYYWKTDDLIDLSQHQSIRITDRNQSMGVTGERAWAPKVIYDVVEENYKIFYSDPKGEVGGIFMVSTNDFVQFSYPELFFYPEYEVIDASLIGYQGQYLMFYKDERKGAKTIFYSVMNQISKGPAEIKDDRYLSLVKHLEGPFSFVNKNGEYYLYADNYPNAQFIVLEYTGMNFRQLSEDEFSIPHDVRHGSIVSVTASELNQMLEYYSQ